ncbi:MAG: hypothetical protein AMS15_02545 [Planctomycetes bacterium DG_23]|nr:MAG: hypothetical protein AMS15_02545 [Planctomycetes bacterium DG_23]
MGIDYAKEVILSEARALEDLAGRMTKDFERAVDLILNCRGRVVVSGMGKSGIIGQKISATLASTGTPSLWLHPAEARHGDLGRVTKDDVVVILSNSGQTAEITHEKVGLLGPISKIGAKIIAITGAPESPLGKHSDVVLDLGKIEEASPLEFAPTASTTAMLALGDALALSVLKRKGFAKKEVAFYHPAGNSVKEVLKVEDVMREKEKNPTATAGITVEEATSLVSQVPGRAGAVSIVDQEGKLIGIFTDGDLRRQLLKDRGLLKRPIGEVMTRNPKTIKLGSLATEAFRILQEYKIDEIPVVDEEGRLAGIIDVQDLLEVGVIW